MSYFVLYRVIEINQSQNGRYHIGYFAIVLFLHDILMHDFMHSRPKELGISRQSKDLFVPFL